VLEISSDNMAALAMMDRFKSSSPPITLIAREIALDVPKSTFRPAIRTHVAGTANVMADILSRRYQPDKVFGLPKSSNSCIEVQAPGRPQSYYKSLALK